MYSSRMRSARFSGHLRREVFAWGCFYPGRLSAWGVSLRGVCLGVSAWGGVCPLHQESDPLLPTQRQTPLPVNLMTDRQV